MENIKKDNPGKKIIIILDNASYHKTKSVLSLQKELNFEFYFLPPYCPQLNLQENVNAYVKRQIRNFNALFYNQISHYKDNIGDLLYQLTEIILAKLASRSFFTNYR